MRTSGRDPWHPPISRASEQTARIPRVSHSWRPSDSSTSTGIARTTHPHHSSHALHTPPQRKCTRITHHTLIYPPPHRYAFLGSVGSLLIGLPNTQTYHAHTVAVDAHAWQRYLQSKGMVVESKHLPRYTRFRDPKTRRAVRMPRLHLEGTEYTTSNDKYPEYSGYVADHKHIRSTSQAVSVKTPAYTQTKVHQYRRSVLLLAPHYWKVGVCVVWVVSDKRYRQRGAAYSWG